MEHTKEDQAFIDKTKKEVEICVKWLLNNISKMGEE